MTRKVSTFASQSLNSRKSARGQAGKGANDEDEVGRVHTVVRAGPAIGTNGNREGDAAECVRSSRPDGQPGQPKERGRIQSSKIQSSEQGLWPSGRSGTDR